MRVIENCVQHPVCMAKRAMVDQRFLISGMSIYACQATESKDTCIADEGQIWKRIVDEKYLKSIPNIFASRCSNPSKFWHGVLWVDKALKLGYRWVVGNGKKDRFLEDTWLRTSLLFVQFLPLCSICHHRCATVAEFQDRSSINLTFLEISGRTALALGCICSLINSKFKVNNK